MVGALVVTHGDLARELVRAAGRILGPVEGLEAVSIAWEEDVESARRMIHDGLQKVGGQGAIVMTDMFGGTPANLSLSFLESGKVEIVTGVNLPMLIRFCKIRGEGSSLQEIAKAVCAGGRDHIRIATESLKPHPTGGRA